MANEIYPFAQIIQGNFAGMYVYWCKLYQNYHIRSGSVFKNGLLSLDVWGNSAYTYDFGDIIGYEEIGSAAHSANAGSVLMGGFLFGTVGAIAASAAGSGTTHDTVIYFKDGKQCVFRFLNGTSHQNYITGFHQRGINPGNPFAVQPKKEKIESDQPTLSVSRDDLLSLPDELEENAKYDLYADICIPPYLLSPHEVDDCIQYLRKYTDNLNRVKQQMVGFLLVFHCVKSILSSTLQVSDIAPNNWFCHLIHSEDLHFLHAPSLEKSKGLLIALHGFLS